MSCTSLGIKERMVRQPLPKSSISCRYGVAQGNTQDNNFHIYLELGEILLTLAKSCKRQRAHTNHELSFIHSRPCHKAAVGFVSRCKRKDRSHSRFHEPKGFIAQLRKRYLDSTHKEGERMPVLNLPPFHRSDKVFDVVV
jgi:hypothetical protein